MWVRNIPVACQVSERTEPHSGSDPLQHRPLSAKKVSVKIIQTLGFFTVKPQWLNSLATSAEILTPLRDSYLWVLGFLMPFLCHLRAMWKTRQSLKFQFLLLLSSCISFFCKCTWLTKWCGIDNFQTLPIQTAFQLKTHLYAHPFAWASNPKISGSSSHLINWWHPDSTTSRVKASLINNCSPCGQCQRALSLCRTKQNLSVTSAKHSTDERPQPWTTSSLWPSLDSTGSQLFRNITQWQDGLGWK